MKLENLVEFKASPEIREKLAFGLAFKFWRQS